MKRLATVILVALLLGACARPAPPAQREGEIIYLNSNEIRTQMHKMAAMIFNLDLLVLDPPAISPDEQQRAVVEQLGEIEKVAINLGAGPKRTNHYLIDSGIDRLVEEINRAREAARAEPSDFEPSLDVIRQCKRCHLMR